LSWNFIALAQTTWWGNTSVTYVPIHEPTNATSTGICPTHYAPHCDNINCACRLVDRLAGLTTYSLRAAIFRRKSHATWRLVLWLRRPVDISQSTISCHLSLSLLYICSEISARVATILFLSRCNLTTQCRRLPLTHSVDSLSIAASELRTNLIIYDKGDGGQLTSLMHNWNPWPEVIEILRKEYFSPLCA
jgi:hypothetical protein